MALLAPGEAEQGLLAYTLGSDGSGGDLLCRPATGSRLPPTPEALAAGLHYVKMDGRAVFKWAVRIVQQSVADCLRHAGLTVDDLDLIVLHQANVRIIDAAVEALGMDRGKVVVNLDRYGNTSAGSIPLALDEAVRGGRLRRGQRVLLSGFGAGLAWGTGIFHW
jgi:3-oxoacyl-[acyl-carrier-protein] synthase III